MNNITIKNNDAIYLENDKEENKDEVFYLGLSKLKDIELREGTLTISLEDDEGYEFRFSVSECRIDDLYPMILEQNGSISSLLRTEILPPSGGDIADSFKINIGDSVRIRIQFTKLDEGLGLELIGNDFKILSIPAVKAA